MFKKTKLLLVSLLFAAGCSSAPIGPTSGIAQSTVKGSLDDVNQHAQTVLQQMNIQVTGMSMTKSGHERQLVGKTGDTDVTVTIDSNNNQTSDVKVQASKNIVSGNKNLAQDILNRIVQQG